MNESLIDLNEAAKLPVFRVKGRKPHVSALYRWIHAGLFALDGSRVQLETIRTPSGRKTSHEAVARFIARLNGQAAPSPTKPRCRQVAAAVQELEGAGFVVGAGT